MALSTIEKERSTSLPVVNTPLKRDCRQSRRSRKTTYCMLRNVLRSVWESSNKQLSHRQKWWCASLAYRSAYSPNLVLVVLITKSVACRRCSRRWRASLAQLRRSHPDPLIGRSSFTPGPGCSNQFSRVRKGRWHNFERRAERGVSL